MELQKMSQVRIYCDVGCYLHHSTVLQRVNSVAAYAFAANHGPPFSLGKSERVRTTNTKTQKLLDNNSE